MKDSDKLLTSSEMISLREGIKTKYKEYHLLDRDRFPDFDYNTNRANYEPLRESFNEEFYVARGIDRDSHSIHIPSTNTLALIFTDDSYVPTRKIRNTCQLYAEDKENAYLVADKFITRPSEKWKTTLAGQLPLFGVVLIIAVGFIVYTYLTQPGSPPTASELVIYQPHNGQTVPRILYLEGKVTDADVVWIVVKPTSQGEKCYVQSPVIVQKDGVWKGVAYIGTPGKRTAGMTFQIRAFVNPGGTYEAIEGEGKYVFDSWPEEAELSTEVVEVVRGADG